MDEVRFGLIGAGQIGRFHAVTIAKRVPGAKIVAVCDTNPQALSECLSAPDPDTAVTTLLFENGAVATIDNSRLSDKYDQRLELFGADGTTTVENVTPDKLSRQPLPFYVERYAESYVAEMTAFVRCVIDGTPPLVTGDDGRAALVLALAAQRSYREGCVVSLSSF